MGQRWTAENDQRLFFIITDLVKLDHKAIADEWKKRYGTFVQDLTNLSSMLTRSRPRRKFSANC